MPLKTKILFFLFLGFIACRIQKKETLPVCQLGNYTLKNCDCTKTNPIDSSEQKGEISGPGFKLQYQYGPAVPKGPQDEKEYIEQSFRAYHYKKFFDFIHIDTKVQKLFRDSVTLTEIKYIQPGEDTYCSACNVMLNLRFKGNQIPFGIFITPSLLADLNKAGFSYPQHPEMRIKLFNHEEIKGGWLGLKKSTKTSPSLYLELKEGEWTSFEKWINQQGQM